jgi:sulfur carrier protein ThiS
MQKGSDMATPGVREPQPGHIRICFINSFGEGYAKWFECPAGTTVAQFLQRFAQDVNPENAALRVGGKPVAATDVLQDQDRMTAVPSKGEGAGPDIQARVSILTVLFGIAS